ncbi:hypothetical protein VCHA53O466_50375 [Vibrio chagasii]|nr:hypothetical protein VCHA53O466_50375 [Vibrio chagasii]
MTPSVDLIKAMVNNSTRGDLVRNLHAAIDRNEEKTVELTLELMADNEQSKLILGKAYMHGKGAKKHPATARRLLEQLAVKGNAKAQLSLAEGILDGSLPPQQENESFYWHGKAAQGGSHQAQYRLGMLYAEGELVQQNHRLANIWWKKSAAQGNTDAQFALANQFYFGVGVEKCEATSKQLFYKAAIGGHTEAQLALGKMYREEPDIKDSALLAEHFLSLAANNSLEAKVALGSLYVNELRASKHSSDKAMRWLFEAVKGNSIEAAELLVTLTTINSTN